MAAKKDDNERKRMIEEVGKYFLETGESTRKIAKKFGISNATVSDYLDKYMVLHPNDKEKIQDLRENNTPKSIKNLEIKNRVISVIKGVINGDNTVVLSKKMNISGGTIYNDVHIRALPVLEQMDPTRLKDIFDSSNIEDIMILLSSRLKENSSSGRRK